MITIQASISKGWLSKHGSFYFPSKYYHDPLFRREEDSRINSFVRERFPDTAIYNMESNLVQAAFVQENHVLVGAIQPNMILAALLGAEFSFFEDKDADVRGRPLEKIADKKELPPVDSILEHPLVVELDQQIRDITTGYPQLRVIPPFFWDTSGRATIHGIVTTSLKLTGDMIMTLMITDPELAHAIHQWIVDAYLTLIFHFAGPGHLEITSVHVGECAGTMVSSELYEEFVIPYINQLGSRLGIVRLHSCGFSDHLISPALKIDNLGIFDTGSDTSIKKIREVLGKELEINVAPPVRLLQEGAPESGILEWLDKTLVENRGGPLKIVYHMEPDYEVANCLALHRELENRGLIKPGRIY